MLSEVPIRLDDPASVCLLAALTEPPIEVPQVGAQAHHATYDEDLKTEDEDTNDDGKPKQQIYPKKDLLSWSQPRKQDAGDNLCYNGVDVTRFYPGERCWPPALQGASLVIGTLCAFRKEKALPTLLEAFARVRSLRPHLKLLLVGDGPLRKDLQERSARLGLAEDCHFEPATADVARWFHATDIFVLPSVSEALSNSLMEAMACGCCAVASRVGGNPELVTHERTGLLFTAGDVAGLAACLQRLIEQPGLAQELAAAGAAHLRERFSTQVAARRMEEIYTGLIGSADAGRQLI